MGKIKPIILISLVLISAFFSFYPSLNNGFTNWDDYIYVVNNPVIKDFSLKGLSNIFTTFHRGLYKPFVFLSFALEYHFFQLNPFAYHITNLVFHLINCILVFVFIFILCANLRVAFISALLFGIHPLHVESVAWISERKDMIYSFFYLCSLISYLNFLKGKGMKYYYSSLVLFIASLFSKPMGISLPFIILICDYLLGIKFDKKNLLQKIPFFAIIIVFVALTFNATKEFIYNKPNFNALDNIFIACYGFLFYIVKLFMPFNLSAYYPYPLKTGNYLPVVFLLSPLAVISLLWGAFKTSKYTKDIIFGIVFYLAVVLPALQLVPAGPAVTADRYAYISSIGIFYIVGKAIVWLYSKKLRNIFLRAVVSVFLVFITAALLFLTRDRCKVWHDSMILWSDAISKFPDARLPYQNRGPAYAELGDFDKAISDFKRAISLDPGHCGLYEDLGNAYASKGDFESAFSNYNRSLQIDPKNGKAYYNRAVAYFIKKEYNKAWEDVYIAEDLGYDVDFNFLEDLKKESGRQE